MPHYVVALDAAAATDPARVGPKAANLATLTRAGLPTPGGCCLLAQAYRAQLEALELGHVARQVFGSADPAAARAAALRMRLGLTGSPIVPAVREPLLDAWRALVADGATRLVVRSSALVEDRHGSSFAGQFESFLGLDTEDDFLTAVRACWAALWSTRALRYMATHDVDPADTAMALLIQPLVEARAAGGALSRTAEGRLLINATWGLGAAIAQGEVAPDRYLLEPDGALADTTLGTDQHPRPACGHAPAIGVPARRAAPHACLEPAQIAELGALVRGIDELMAMPVEVEWALDATGFKLLQARPLRLEPATAPDERWRRHPRLNGQPAGTGWATGRACVVSCECELARVAPGDVLVTRMAGPALAAILPRVSGVVAELGGSTSHLASLARERGIPMVLGAGQATRLIPEGSMVAVDGVAGIVRWMPAEPLPQHARMM
jgi:pyruvate,water dikinase